MSFIDPSVYCLALCFLHTIMAPGPQQDPGGPRPLRIIKPQQKGLQGPKKPLVSLCFPKAPNSAQTRPKTQSPILESRTAHHWSLLSPFVSHIMSLCWAVWGFRIHRVFGIWPKRGILFDLMLGIKSQTSWNSLETHLWNDAWVLSFFLFPFVSLTLVSFSH